jgi:hypothetical protein
LGDGPVAFSPDGRTLATGAMTQDPPPSGARRVESWDVASAGRTATLPVPFRVDWLDFTPDGRGLVGRARRTLNDPPDSPQVIVWDVPALHERFRLTDGSLKTTRADRLFTMNDGFVRAIDVNSGAARFGVQTPLVQVHAAPTAVGPWLMVMDEEMSMVDQCREWLHGHGVPVPGTPTVRPVLCLLDAATGREFDRLPGVSEAEMSPAGDTLAVLTVDGETQLWDVPWRPPLPVFAATAAGLAAALAGFAWRRTRKLRTMG